MKKLTLTLTVFTILLTSTLAVPAFAQEGRSLETYSKEVALQYSLLRDIGETGSLGIGLDFGKALKPGISLVGEIALHRFSGLEETYTQGAAGIRFGRLAGSKSRPFIQMMVGSQRSFGSSGIVFQPGAGMNVTMGGRTDAKFQVDFPVVRWHGKTYKQVRLNVGLGFALGKK